MIQGNRDPLKKYGFTALINLQFNFLGRVDDTCALMIDEIKSHGIYKDFALSFRMCRSKNVMEERLTPFQTMLAANNCGFCSHIFLATFLELCYPTEMNENGELDCFGSINRSANGIK